MEKLNMSGLDGFFGFINAMYVPFDWLFSIAFFYCDALLRTLSISVVLILTLGKILDIFKRKIWLAIKIILYIWFFGYTLYTLGIFENLSNLENIRAIDWTAFAFSILAPVSMLIVGKQIGSVRIKGHKIFFYYSIMGLYLLFSMLWYALYPEQIIFTALFIYWFVALFIVSLINYVKGG